MIKIAPSILSADFARLGEEINSVHNSGADYLHFDVMDGCFVPNISFGLPVLESVRKSTDMFLDAHLMITRPVRYAERFCLAGADLVNVHVEADSRENILKTIDIVKSCGKKAGITLKPATKAEEVLPFINAVDMILVMTVEPGFGGQKFMSGQLDKIRKIRALIDSLNPDCELEVDGGIDESTASYVKEAGANVLVAGSAIFRKADRAEVINKLRNN